MTEEQNKALQVALAKFADAAQELDAAWPGEAPCLGEGYPFKESFDDVSGLIDEWCQSSVELLELHRGEEESELT